MCHRHFTTLRYTGLCGSCSRTAWTASSIAFSCLIFKTLAVLIDYSVIDWNGTPKWSIDCLKTQRGTLGIITFSSGWGYLSFVLSQIIEFLEISLSLQALNFVVLPPQHGWVLLTYTRILATSSLPVPISLMSSMQWTRISCGIARQSMSLRVGVWQIR